MESFFKMMPQKVESALAYGQSISNMERPEYQGIKEDLQNLFSQNFNINVDIHFFGGRLMGFANQESDADIFVDVGGAYHSSIIVYARNWVLKSKDAFIKDPKFKFVEAVPHSIVPIQIVKHVATGWKCDISFSNGFAVENSLFMMHLFEMQPEAKKLVFFVCIWCKHYGINIKDFTLEVLVVFFLQTRGFMPTVKQIQDRCSVRKIENFTVGFDKYASLTTFGCQKMGGYRSLVREFFEYYSSFDYPQKLICPYLGKVIGKIEKSVDMDAINKHIGACVLRWNQSQAMIVLVPLNSGHNLTNALMPHELAKFKENCRLAAQQYFD